MRHAKSLLAFALCASALSCRSMGPRVTVCVVDYRSNGMQCVDPDDQASFISFEQAENYVCLSPRDTETLLKACRGAK
jgi:hypothetical protein